MEEMTTLNKVDDFENVDLVDAMPPVSMPIQSMSNVPLESSTPRTHGGAASVAHPLIWPILNGELNKFKMASLICTEMKNVKAIEDAGLIPQAQNKQMRDHKLVINEIKCRVRDEWRQHPDLSLKGATERVLRTINEVYPSLSGWSANRLREHCTERLKQRADPRSNDKPTLEEDFAFELSRDLE
ncbi:MAG: hypothetical protein J3Q66DRAFT_434873 [Benniella sp.]|nr:MAG: hypothetical protein J3Q66DRAFT_434873 [Benniella sp.]